MLISIKLICIQLHSSSYYALTPLGGYRPSTKDLQRTRSLAFFSICDHGASHLFDVLYVWNTLCQVFLSLSGGIRHWFTKGIPNPSPSSSSDFVSSWCLLCPRPQVFINDLVWPMDFQNSSHASVYDMKVCIQLVVEFVVLQVSAP